MIMTYNSNFVEMFGITLIRNTTSTYRFEFPLDYNIESQIVSRHRIIQLFQRFNVHTINLNDLVPHEQFPTFPRARFWDYLKKNQVKSLSKQHFWSRL